MKSFSPSAVIVALLLAVMLVCGVSACLEGKGERWDSFLHEGDRLLNQKLYTGPRSTCWTATRAEWLRENPECAFKGCKSKDCEPHHVKAFTDFPELECDPDNLLTLCRTGENHHLWIGHQGNYRETNRQVRADCAAGRFPRIGWERKQRHDQRERNRR